MRFNGKNIPQYMRNALKWIPLEGKRAYLKEWQNKGNRFETVANTTAQKGNAAAGFIINDTGLAVVDIDRAVDDDGKTSPEVKAVFDKVKELAGKTYAERSISGKGFHIFLKADVPDLPAVFKIPLGGETVAEFYTGNGGAKYFAVTGDKISKTDRDTIAEGTAFFEWAYNWFLEKYPQKKKAAATDPDERPKNTQQDNGPNDTTNTAQDIVNLIGKIRNSQQGPDFVLLFDEGDTSKYNGDDSAADQALANILAYWCQKDKALMKEIFDLSALAQRDKYKNRPDYVEMTINKAIRDVTEVYNPNYRPRNNNPDVIECPEWPVTVTQGTGKNAHIVPVKEAWENTEYLLSELGIRCKFNQLTKKVEIEGHKLDELSLESAATSVRSLVARNGLKLTKNDTYDHIYRIGDQNVYNPVKDYLNECKESWFGDDELEKLFNCFVIRPEYMKNRDFYLKLFAKWLLSCAKIAFNNGDISLQGILVLQGPQGIGKTRFLRMLVPDISWVIDGISIDTSNKDSLLRALGHWIAEIGEMGATLKRRQLNEFKQFVTANVDEIRRPYGHEAVCRPRTTAFIGTINEDEFLKDSTGDRRFWVIPIEAIEGIKNIDMAQVWGQVMQMAEAGFHYWLDKDEINTLEEISQPFKKKSYVELAILDRLDWDKPINEWNAITSTEVCTMLHLDRRSNAQVGRAINAIMKNEDRIKKASNHMNGKWYLLPPVKDLYENEDSVFWDG